MILSLFTDVVVVGYIIPISIYEGLPDMLLFVSVHLSYAVCVAKKRKKVKMIWKKLMGNLRNACE